MLVVASTAGDGSGLNIEICTQGRPTTSSPEEWLQAQADQNGFVTFGWGIHDHEQPICPLDLEKTSDDFATQPPRLIQTGNWEEWRSYAQPAPPKGLWDASQKRSMNTSGKARRATGYLISSSLCITVPKYA